MENKHQQLLKNLPSYGLNPKDWKIQKINSKNYILRNRKDDDLCLWGQLNDIRDYHWKELQWLTF
jgi:hypothetical protein